MKTIWKYKNYLSPIEDRFKVKIGEGQTALIRSRYIGPTMGLQNLYFKLENLNPTGSYKDRFAAALVGTLLQKQSGYCISTSSGNTGAALAAYCAAAQIKCHLFIVDGTPAAKIHQMQLFGATTTMIEGFGIDTGITNYVFSVLKEFTEAKSLSLPISAYCYCPEGMQGVQTIAYEILDDLKSNVDHILAPSGGGGLTLAIARGVLGYHSIGCSVHCVQPKGNDTIASALLNGSSRATEISKSTTQISGLQVPGILDGHETLRHCSKTGGTGFTVDDARVFETQKMLALREGIFCEPAGAVSVSCLADALKNGQISKNETVVCIISGSGFKDMNMAVQKFGLSSTEKKNNVKNLSELLITIENNEPF